MSIILVEFSNSPSKREFRHRYKEGEGWHTPTASKSIALHNITKVMVETQLDDMAKGIWALDVVMTDYDGAQYRLDIDGVMKVQDAIRKAKAEDLAKLHYKASPEVLVLPSIPQAQRDTLNNLDREDDYNHWTYDELEDEAKSMVDMMKELVKENP